MSIVAALAGMGSVALLVLTPHAALDAVGVAAALAAASSMADGNVLAREWQPPASRLSLVAYGEASVPSAVPHLLPNR